MAELIITEKPSAAKKVAEALADGKVIKESINKVPYYRVTHNGKDLLVACAVGHLYTVGEKEKSPWSRYPVFDVSWMPTAEVDKTAAFSKKYLSVIKKLCKQADEFTVACDYDIEGEVIGLNVVRYACKAKDAARMKFSTLTKPDLRNAYKNKFPSLDWGQALAGETRHILDFYYGINLTRALTDAINAATSGFKVLSVGRVQGPALKIVVEKEKEIRKFVPVPYWQIELDGLIKEKTIQALHQENKFWEKPQADQVMERVKHAKRGTIIKTEKKKFNQSPPVPFDLTSLQVEAYRVFKIRPKHTLDLAQNLYTEGYISYPRTSSQKLPASLGFATILNQLKKQATYAELASQVLQTSLRPNEGKKTDDAHPSIYPTGLHPKQLGSQEAKLYDLIVKRFFAVFGDPAVRETNTLTIEINQEPFVAKGTVTLKPGWHHWYAPYVKLEEMELPPVHKGDEVEVRTIQQLAKETKPPRRYTQSSIISELEKQGLGTKATRAQVVETLFQRGYVTGESNIEATELGIKTEETLSRYSPDILDPELTRKFEEDMEHIRKKKLKGEVVLEEAKKVLSKLINTFTTKKKIIGKELSEANQEAIKIATTLGPCPNCDDGELVIKKGKFGRFAACNNYPDCKTTYALPKTGTLKPLDKQCTHCNLPLIKVRRPRQGPQEHCLNPDCPSKGNGNGEETGEQTSSYPEENTPCPVCKEGKMVLRKSFYGQFLGCNRYPKCKTMMKIVDGKVDTTPITPKQKKYAKKSKKSKRSHSSSTKTKKAAKKSRKT